MDRLTNARLIGQRTLGLLFADGKAWTLRTDKLGMPVDWIQWRTVKAAPDGKTMTVKAVNGGLMPVFATTLRYLVDKVYAAKVDARVDELSGFLDTLTGEGRPPAELLGRTVQDAALDSPCG